MEKAEELGNGLVLPVNEPFDHEVVVVVRERTDIHLRMLFTDARQQRGVFRPLFPSARFGPEFEEDLVFQLQVYKQLGMLLHEPHHPPDHLVHIPFFEQWLEVLPPRIDKRLLLGGQVGQIFAWFRVARGFRLGGSFHVRVFFLVYFVGVRVGFDFGALGKIAELLCLGILDFLPFWPG